MQSWDSRGVPTECGGECLGWRRSGAWGVQSRPWTHQSRPRPAVLPKRSSRVGTDPSETGPISWTMERKLSNGGK